MTSHLLKTNQGYRDAVRNGEKTFEVRRNDRGFQKGDNLVLLPEGYCMCGQPGCTTNGRLPTPITLTITYVFSGDPSLRDGGGIVPGYVVLGFRQPEDGALIARVREAEAERDRLREAVDRIADLAAEHRNCSGCPAPWWLTDALHREAVERC